LKKTSRIIIALILALCCLLGGCGSANSEPEATDETTTDQKTNRNENKDYLNIPLKECSKFVTSYYCVKDAYQTIGLKLCENWEEREDGEGGRILLRDGKEIGRIVLGAADDLSEWKDLDQQTFSSAAGLIVNQYLEKSGTGATLRFRHRYTYSYSEDGVFHRITLTINYGELDKAAQDALRKEVEYGEYTLNPRFNELSELRDKRILVVGNSFIGTSQIGNVYNEIAERSGKEELMMAVSEGYATVKTYAESEYFINRVENGDWSAVFVCGFYTDMNQDLGIIKRACEKSGTKLIIFPAHNENRAMIESAKRAYPSLLCLDWKREIDELIAEGRDKWDFCYDDEHLHSTPLAGYVGAMMIWRAIYGEMPSVDINDTYLPQDNYDAILGDYLTSPAIKLIDISKITFLE